MPPLFQAVKTTKSTLDNTAIVNGKVYFAQDSEQLFFDYDDSRTEIRDIVVLDTETDRTDILAPKNKFYFVVGTATLWLYRNGTWLEVSGGSGISLAFASFSAGSNIASVTLDTAVSGIGSIISVNVDNMTLLRSAYTLGDDYKTITFAEAITCELGIEVVYSSSDTASTASVASYSEDTGIVTTNSYSVTSVSDTELTLSPGNIYQLELAGDTNVSFGTWTSGMQESIILYLSVPGSYTLTLPANIKWKDGSAPSLEIDGNYILEFRSIDGGTVVYGSISKYV